ncbi:MAG TPA: ABC transporter substrate-binding protein [Candidatus Binataceae bacterium]|nr:ABC transporter substrate-binding protein [Candidatus Binataceae bacterium]
MSARAVKPSRTILAPAVRRACAAAALMLAALACAAGCRVNRPKIDHAREQILYDATSADPRTFNPILITDATSGAVVGDLFESLIRVNVKTLLPEPGLAESWDIAPDQKSITFHMRHGLKWFDGAPLDARDVAFTMKVIYDPKIANSIRPSLLIDGKEIESDLIDNYTLTMRLPRPFAPLLYEAAGITVLPEHTLGPAYAAGRFNQIWGINTPPRELVGDGSFKMTRYVQSQVVQYQRNPDFWMKDAHGGELPRLHGRALIIVQDQNTDYLKFLSGQTDVYAPRPKDVIDLKDKAGALGIMVAKIGIDTGELFFSFNRNPKHFVHHGVADPKLAWFTDKNFLLAIAHSIDKQGIINLCYHGLAVPAVAEISPANKIFHNPNLKDYDYDLSEAARLLEAGGYHLARPGVRVDSHGNPIVFTLTTNADSQERQQMCAILKQDLSKLGIQVNFRPLDFQTLVEKLDSTFDWDCILMGFTGGFEPNDGADFLRSSGNLHIWYPNQNTPATPWEAEIDQLMDQGTTVMDPPKRAPYYWRIQEILHEQLPIIETVRQTRYAAWKNSLENYQPTVWGLYHPEWTEFKPN